MIWKWEVEYRCRECLDNLIFEYGDETTKQEIVNRHNAANPEKCCPLCGQGKSQLMSIQLVGRVDLRESAL